MTAVELIGARRLRDEFNRGGFLLFELEAVLRRRKNQAGLAAGLGAFGKGGDFEAVVVVDRGNLELHLGPGLYVNGRRRKRVLLRSEFHHLNGLLLRAK